MTILGISGKLPDYGQAEGKKTVFIWRSDGTWKRINAVLRVELRVADGREPEPSAAILYS